MIACLTMGTTVQEGHFTSFDGLEIFFQAWPEAQPSALVVGVHGLGEHSGSYIRLAEGLKGSGFQFCMADLRGHGRSGGKRGVGTIDECVSDTKLFLQTAKELYPGLPVFLLGHSMGGLVATKTLIKNSDMKLNGLVLSSPLLGVSLEIPGWKRSSVNFLSKTLPNLTLFNEIPDKNLTHDLAVVQSYGQDHLRHSRISPRMFASMLESMDFVLANAGQVKVPVLMQQAGEDLIVSRPKAEKLFKNFTVNDKELIIYDDYYHEVYNEVGRPRVFEELKRWLSKHK
jgi:alpha-beta hydrolase superfamily lysophospholipase